MTSRRKQRHPNREHFLKWLPFNFCDRYCERCEEFRDQCKIYQDNVSYKLRCEAEGKDPYDPQVVFEEVGRNLGRALAMVEKKMEEEGIEITKEDKEESMRKEERIRKKIKSNALYKKCRDFLTATRKLTEDLEVFFVEKEILLASIGPELQEIGYYAPLVLVKTDRALYSKFWDEEDEVDVWDEGWSDAIVSAALGYFSLLACEASMKSVLGLFEDLERNGEDTQGWSRRLGELLNFCERTKGEFQNMFSNVENNRDKIIFHGRREF